MFNINRKHAVYRITDKLVNKFQNNFKINKLLDATVEFRYFQRLFRYVFSR